MKSGKIFKPWFLCCILMCPKVFAFLPNNIFATKDSRIFDMFCIESAEELEDLTVKTRTHDDITLEAIKRVIVVYFKEKQPDINIDTSMTLSAIFQQFYGNCASSLNFLKSVKEFSDTIVSMDSLSVIKDDPRYHFDAEFIAESQAFLVDRHAQIISAATVQEKFPSARQLMGKSLHAIQKFYSHSNWLDVGVSDPNFSLGVPGSSVGDVASGIEDTCALEGSVITEKITSGYNRYHNVDGENITFPETVKKCHHGGSLDVETAGINKDTSSSCFSPGYLHHSAAADQAVEATEYYIQYIRNIIGDDNFEQLFNLAEGSALVIVIDTTGSMSGEIEAVKEEVEAIVTGANSLGAGPSTYILVPFNDPQVGPPTRTTDPDEFLLAVNSLYAGCCGGSGGTDKPEMFWGGLFMALSYSPMNSDIICFTDAVGKDGEKMQSVQALAQERRARISIVTSLISKDITTVEDYQEICAATGGLFIPASKVDVDQIVGILSKSIETSKATIAIFSKLTGFMDLSFPIDNFWKADSNAKIEIKISGGVNFVILSLSSSVSVDLFDEESINNSDLDIEIFVNQEGILYFSFSPNENGDWNLNIDNNHISSNTYSVNIEASCTFSFLSDFRFLDLASSHPSLRINSGQPVTGSLPVFQILMVSSSSEQISSLENIVLVNEHGEVLASYQKDGNRYEDTFMVQTAVGQDSLTPLPQTPFFIRLSGKDCDGNTFWRMLTNLNKPASTQVEVTASSAFIEGLPGEEVSADFIIFNYGTEAEITVNVIDELNFITGFSPDHLFLSAGESFTMTSTFLIPLNAEVGSESLATVTAQSQLDFTSNYALANIKVISDDTDLNPPNCSLNSVPNCSGIAQDDCSETPWSAMGWVQDVDSGLQTVRVDTSEESSFTHDNFTVGSTGNFSFKLQSNCCNRKARVAAIDMKGNVGSCNIDLPGFTCSHSTYCQVTAHNLVSTLEGVETEAECQRSCIDSAACHFYSWFSEEHAFPSLPTAQFTCFLLSSCDLEYVCDVCFSGPAVCGKL